MCRSNFNKCSNLSVPSVILFVWIIFGLVILRPQIWYFTDQNRNFRIRKIMMLTALYLSLNKYFHPFNFWMVLVLFAEQRRIIPVPFTYYFGSHIIKPIVCNFSNLYSMYLHSKRLAFYWLSSVYGREQYFLCFFTSHQLVRYLLLPAKHFWLYEFLYNGI